MLHGFPEASLSWVALVDPLLDAGHFALYMPDQRGYNTSSVPAQV